MIIHDKCAAFEVVIEQQKKRIEQLETKLKAVKQWVETVNEYEGEYDVAPEDIQELKNITA